MWLNILILTIASLSVGFLLGWIVFRPKRWDYVYNTLPAGYRRDEENVVRLTSRR